MVHQCEQKDCKHESVKYCPQCEKVYCEKCGREWEDKCTLNHFPNTFPAYTEPYRWTVTCGNDISCTHIG